MALHGPPQALMLDEGTVFDEAVCGWHDIHDPGGNVEELEQRLEDELSKVRSQKALALRRFAAFAEFTPALDAEATETGPLSRDNRAEAGAGGNFGNHGATACPLPMVRSFQSL